MSNRRVVNVQSLSATGATSTETDKSSASTSSRLTMAPDGWPAADGAHEGEGRSPATNLVALVLCTMIEVLYCPRVLGLFIGVAA